MDLKAAIQSRSTARSIWFGLAVFHACIVALAIFTLYQSRVEAHRDAIDIVTGMSRAVNQTFDSVVNRFEWGVSDVAEAMEQYYATGQKDQDLVLNRIAILDARTPDSLGFHVFGADGAYLFGLHGVEDATATIADRAYFLKARDDPKAGTIVVAPFMGRVTKQMGISFVRRINKSDGGFGGVVVASITVKRLSDMFEWSNLGEHGATLVFNADHVMLMRYPTPKEGYIGQSILSDHARALIDANVDAANYDVISPVDGLNKLVGFRKIRNHPLFTLVAYAESDYLMQWHQDAANVLAFGLTFIVLSTLAAWQLAIRIGERDRAELALKNSFDRYDQLVSNIPWGVYTFRMNQTGKMAFEYVSPRFCQILGLSEDDLLRDVSVALRLIHPDDMDEFLELNSKASQTLDPFYWKGRFVIDGQERVFKIESSATPAADGESLWNGVMADVTEQERAEEKLRELDEKLRGLYELSPLGIALTSSTGRFVEFNEAFRAITGYSEQQLKTLDFWKLTPEKYRDDEMRQLESLDRTGAYGPYRKEYINRDGALVPIQLNGLRLVGVGGETYTWSIVENVSERLRAEEEQRLSLERFRLMTGGIKDHSIVLLDSQGCVLTWNDGAKRLFRYSEDEIVGRPVGFFYADEDAKIDKAGGLLARSVAEGVAEDEGWLVRMDQTRFWADVSVSCLHSEDGQSVGFVMICRDINDRKLAEDNLRLTAALFEKSQEGIIVTDLNRKIVEVNDAFVKVTGYSRQEVLGRDPKLLKSNHHDQDFYRVMWQAIAQTGHWIGEIWNRRKGGEIYPELLSISAITNDKGEITNYLGIATDLSRLKNQERQLEQIAHYDTLTGIANRTLLADRMEHAFAVAKRDGSLVGICYLDLDGFKPINDDYGHLVGDKVLVEVARRILGIVRGTDTVARLGGDEFVVLLVGLDRVEECTEILENLLTAIAKPISIDAREYGVTASIGVSVYLNDDGDPDTLLRHADKAMFVAKDMGRNRYHFFDAEQDVLTREHFQTLQRVREAVDAGEFELYYQPKVDMRTNQVVGAEALIRWNHPERGLVPPLEFLPLIENTDLEITVGEWVIDAALNQLSLWQKEGHHLEVSINISASHLQSKGFIDVLESKLAAYPDLLPGYLEIEVLETAALQDLNKATAIITECKNKGVSFALDDFGTGYSSLTYLRSIPAETLKIDQTFVRDMLEDQGDRAIVEGIIMLARAFDLKVVAEGVETTEHYRMLVKMGCQIGQGYGIARPMPVGKFIGWYQSLSDTAQPTFAR